MKRVVLLLFSVIWISVVSGSQIIPDQQEKNSIDTLKARLTRAQSMVRQGNNEEASAIYLSIMKDYPDNKDAVQGWIMANASKAQGGPEFIQKALEELGKQYPENTGIVFFQAFIQASTGQNEMALENFNKLIKLQPDTAVNYIAKGQVLLEMQKFDEAYLALDRATSLDPGRMDIWGMKAIALARLGRYDEALVSINKQIDLVPEFPSGIYNRACIYSLKGDRENALEDLRKAVTMNPSFRKQAVNDDDFKNLFNDEEFKKITMQ